jgi:drug/metabolite transporter (DMT)-like permease
MTISQNRWFGVFMAGISAICYSSLTILIKLALQYDLSVITIVVLRMLFASAFLWLALLIPKRESGRVSREHWLTLFGGVVLAFSVSQLAYFSGLQTVPAGVANFLVYIYPVLVLLMAFVLHGERLTLRKLGVAMLCLLGCGFLSLSSTGELGAPAAGTVLIFAAAIAIALYTTFSQRLLKNYSPLVITAWTMPPIGAVFLILDWNNLSRYAEIPLPAWLVMMATGFLPTCALLLYFGAIGRIGAARTALISTLEPVSTSVIAVLILNEHLTPWQLFGAALILSGLVALEWPEGVKRET